MRPPDHWWTIGFATALTAWGLIGGTYTRRLLRPVQRDARRAVALAQAAPGDGARGARRVYLAKARGLTTANRARLKEADRWTDRIYTPVLVALAAPTLVLAVWGWW